MTPDHQDGSAGSETKEDFLADFRRHSIRPVGFALGIAAGALLLYIALGVLHHNTFAVRGLAEQLRICAFIVCAAVAALCFVQPRLVERRYVLIIGSACVTVLLLISLIPWVYAQAELSAESRLLLPLMIFTIGMYAVARLPAYIAGLIGIATTIIFFVAIAREAPPDISILILSATTFQLLGILVATQIAKREKTLFAAQQSVVSHTRKLEDAASRLSVANNQKTRILRSVAHDIRQPVGAIGLLAHAARLKASSPQAVEELTRRIEECVRVIDEQIESISTLAKIQSTDIPNAVQPVFIRDIFAKIAAIHSVRANSAGVTLRLIESCVPDLAVISNAEKLFAILSNLVDNATKFRRPDSPYSVVILAATSLGETVRLSVTDNGSGMPEKQLQMAFEPYRQVGTNQRSRSLGLGLGLSIVKDAVDSLPDHRMTLASVENLGSRFRLYAPAGARS